MQSVVSRMGSKSRGWGSVEVRFFLPLWLGVTVACVPEGADERASVKSEQQAVARQTVTSTRLTAPTSTSATVRRVAGGYEVEIVSPSGFPPGDITPVMRIGDVEFSSFKESPTAGLYGIVFPLTDAEFAALPNGSSIAVGVGPSSHPGFTFRGSVVGTLDKGVVNK
jgi:hypothetical protein